ncbi:hypothetical protein A3B42_00505 [Candidatus Daviesbacteria bacterium RIFCSPLOWO2_01_FULL_38_10]|nr:MAG: hypothetical protein A3D02_00065 [Candidatus Daviesbacteria bacterium RIFCSPHIGHO2_02_FULL_39_41]OGE39421.1 MAG: hypothetical protein A3B42_00505 [Candidatus Daviesbacteria bacterium RIFCSPLOWO2_01_FULL_38_10]OGE44231.1 MAG: hypothetical protein A3E67_05040 [Candidatus Daviesbacteria bacterium RIFCSPHIGHO2_12_FULL_38_25]OGE68410.1 MAG: hypothetical protein A3H81_02640 [Candidatus Daviesbacteria bacterium RIFCSPLOWO2_02_FULL_38_18]OGE72206.1 MAG: hypothetical protein A3H18_01795 [Candida
MSLTSSRFPYIQVILRVLNNIFKVEALIDTGFDGDVTVPPEMILNGKSPRGYLPWTLASGTKVNAPYFLGKIKIGKFKPFNVLITALGDEPLVGRGVTDKFKVIFDHGRKVVIEL